MDPNRLSIFLSVARHLSYTRAAEELYISQPAVSNHIKALEQELDAQLFDRHGNRIQLTETGKITYNYAVKLDRLLHDLQFDVDQLQETLSGTLRVGASTTISQYVIPSVIAAFRGQHPEVSLSLISGNTQEISDKLQHDEIHIGIIEGPRRSNNFVYSDFISDEIAFIHHPSVSIPARIPVKKLTKIPLIMREQGSGTREEFGNAIQKLGYKWDDLTIKMTLGSTESIKSYLPHTQAAGVVSVRAIRDVERSAYAVARLENHSIRRNYKFIQKQGANLKAARHFIRFARKAIS